MNAHGSSMLSGGSGDPSIQAGVESPETGEFDSVQDWDTLSLPPEGMGDNVWQHVYYGGRRYHLYKHGRYPIPNDDTEQNREDLKHAMMLELTVGPFCLAVARCCRPNTRIAQFIQGRCTWLTSIVLSHRTESYIMHHSTPIRRG